jgi:hypothetical protein
MAFLFHLQSESSKIDCAMLLIAGAVLADAGKADQTAETIKPNE